MAHRQRRRADGRVLDDRRPDPAPRGPGMEQLRLRRSLRRGREGGDEGDRDLARRSRPRPREPQPRGVEEADGRQRAHLPGAGVHLGLLRGRGDRGAQGVRRARGSSSSRPPAPSVPTTSRSGTSPAFPASFRSSPSATRSSARDAANRTDAVIAYEFMPFDVNVDTLDAALEVVEGAGARTEVW